MGAGGAVSACGLRLSEGRTCRRPADRGFEASMGGQAGPRHLTARFAPSPSPRGGGELVSVRRGNGMEARGGRLVPAVCGFPRGQTCQKPYDCQFEASMGGQADASPPHRSLRSGRPLLGEEGSLFLRGGRRRWSHGEVVRCPWFVVF